MRASYLLPLKCFGSTGDDLGTFDATSAVKDVN